MSTRWTTTLLGLSTFACAGPPSEPIPPAPPDSAAALRQLCADYWDALMEHHPTWATYLGDYRFNDRLEDPSPEARAAWKKTIETFRARLRVIDPATLEGEDRITHALLALQLAEHLESMLHKTWQYDIDPMAGVQVRFLELINTAPTEQPRHLDELATRYEAFGTLMDRHIANLREGLRSGRTQFRGAVERVIRQTDQILQTPVEQSPLLRPDKIASATTDQRTRLESAVRQVVYPAYRRYLAFHQEEYLPHARTVPGIHALRDGRTAYAFFVRQHTTTDLTPQEIHRMGLEELERIHAEMIAIARRQGHEGDLVSFLERLRTDPAQHFSSREEIVQAFRDCLERMQVRMDRLFGRIPPIPCEVKPIEDYREADAPAAYYYGPPDPQTGAPPRPGIFYINTFRPETRPRYILTALTAHEAVPGHHFQIATAIQLVGLPAFRRHTGPAAYVEGWALYAELLADEIGMYEDELQRFGMLSEQAWRAARLVVDTGLHEMGWSRDQAIEFFLHNVALSRHEAETEIDRYIVWPAQALAYMIGRRELQALRRQAKEHLGDRFDVREFHDQILRHGALPLSILRDAIDRWCATRGG